MAERRRVPGLIASQEDEAGLQDHPMFTRMKNFHIIDLIP
jgi:hypothetical protein